MNSDDDENPNSFGFKIMNEISDDELGLHHCCEPGCESFMWIEKNGSYCCKCSRIICESCCMNATFGCGLDDSYICSYCKKKYGEDYCKDNSCRCDHKEPHIMNAIDYLQLNSLRIDFGKHRGKYLFEIEDSYLKWLKNLNNDRSTKYQKLKYSDSFKNLMQNGLCKKIDFEFENRSLLSINNNNNNKLQEKYKSFEEYQLQRKYKLHDKYKLHEKYKSFEEYKLLKNQFYTFLLCIKKSQLYLPKDILKLLFNIFIEEYRIYYEKQYYCREILREFNEEEESYSEYDSCNEKNPKKAKIN